MAILAEDFVYVVGVHTHADAHGRPGRSHRRGACLSSAIRPIRPGSAGRGGRRAAPGARLWAVEQTGSYGAGLTALLGPWVRRWSRSIAPPARHAGAARTTASTRSGRPRGPQPRASGKPARARAREALRVLLATRRASVAARTAATAQGPLVTAPSRFAQSLRGLPRAELRTCAALMQRHDEERRAAVLALAPPPDASSPGRGGRSPRGRADAAW